MNQDERRDMSPTPPRDGESDAHEDLDPVRSPPEEVAAKTDETGRYTPRHRAEGRAPLIRRRRNEEGEEISWETEWPGAEDAPDPNEQELSSATTPPPPPIEESYLGPTRVEQRREAERESAPHEQPNLAPEPPSGGAPGHHQPVGTAAGYEATHDDVADHVAAGPRTAALQERKKKKRVRTLAGGLAALVLAAGAIAGAGLLVKNVVDPENQRVAVPFEQAEDEGLGGTILVFGTKESDLSARGAIWMTLLSLDPETGKGSVVYIPSHTAVEVPGRGLQGVGDAYGSGGVPLLLVSAENLLGVKIDRYLELSDKDALVFFENLERMTVDVPAEVRVPAGQDQARLIFVEGPQELSPSLLVQLLYIVGIDGDDIELGSRHLAFWDELLNSYSDGNALASAVEDAGAALGESDASPEELGAFLATLADLPPEDVTITVLPVRPVSAGDSELYATDEEELAAFVEETIGIDQKRPQEIRVQVLNGNGVPGIGQEVADLLVGEGFRVILSGNARRLNYQKTLVVTYDSSDEGVALAERARDLLGVGEVQVSAQQQGIVDLTIVVGKDFLRTR